MADDSPRLERATPLLAILAVTFLGSLGTGMLWNALPFVTKQQYQFSPAENLLLSLVQGAVYIASALGAGAVLRRLRRWVAPRLMLAQVFAVQAAACVMPALFAGKWVPWSVAVVFSASSALLWPIIESYLTSGRHGPAMRWAIGWWNITWTSAIVAPLWMMAPLMGSNPEKIIMAVGVGLLAALIPLGWFSARPAEHDAHVSRSHQSEAYPLLLSSARIILLLSYVILSALNPLLPFLLADRLQVESHWQTPTASAWMVARVAAMAIMWRVTFWHGRWGTLLLGGATLFIGFAAVIAAPNVAALLVALAVLGGGLGIVYYSTLYYSMTVGAAAVDAGGKFEALIGAGYSVGPIAGLAAMELAAAQPIGDTAGRFNTAIISMVWLVMAVGVVAAVRPYLQARSQSRIAEQ